MPRTDKNSTTTAQKVYLQWDDPTTGESRDFTSELPITLGRLPSCTLVLNSSLVSRTHARIEMNGNTMSIIDLGSSNGIKVNGQKVQSAELKQGTAFEIGPYAFTVGVNLSSETVSQKGGDVTIAMDVLDPPVEEVGEEPDAPHPQTNTSRFSPNEVKAALEREAGKKKSQDASATIQMSPDDVKAMLEREAGKKKPSDASATIQMSPDDVKAMLEREAEKKKPQDTSATIQMSPDDVKAMLEREAEKKKPQDASATIRVSASEIKAMAQKVGVLSPAESGAAFPPAFFDKKYVQVADIKRSGLPVDEVKYLALGGGMGSFIWADHLRVYGVPVEDIAAIGFDAKPYGRFRRLCLNSQIPETERLRSDSSGTPDNIWGWPGYALREIFWDLSRGRFSHALKLLWTITGEPTFADTFTPIAGRMFASVDREAARIGWHKIWNYGRVRKLRMTDDGRYVIAYSQTTHGSTPVHKFMIANYVQIALGYPGIRLLPDLMEYRRRTQDFTRVVNAYEHHEHVYQSLIEKGGTVMVRGRGIVASRIIQRLYEARMKNPNIQVVHLNRTPILEGRKFERNRRKVVNHWEIQPLNFPKAAFGGRLRFMLEDADANTRQQLVNDWGGTTTADRGDWQRIVREGLAEGWMKMVFGSIQRVDSKDGKIITRLQESDMLANTEIRTDFVIDATGLNASLDTNPVLKDLLEMYNLERNVSGRVNVTPFFEMDDMRNREGVVMVAGTMAFGGPFAAVDSFTGLQYCAQRSVELLNQLDAPGVGRLGPGRSISQFIKWARGVRP